MAPPNTTQNEHIHIKGVYQIFDTLHTNIVKIVFLVYNIYGPDGNGPRQPMHR